MCSEVLARTKLTGVKYEGVVVGDLLHVCEVGGVLADVNVGFAGVAEYEDGVVEVNVDTGGLDIGGVKGVDDYAPLGDFFPYCSVAQYHADILCSYAVGVGIGRTILAIRGCIFQRHGGQEERVRVGAFNVLLNEAVYPIRITTTPDSSRSLGTTVVLRPERRWRPGRRITIAQAS